MSNAALRRKVISNVQKFVEAEARKAAEAQAARDEQVIRRRQAEENWMCSLTDIQYEVGRLNCELPGSRKLHLHESFVSGRAIGRVSISFGCTRPTEHEKHMLDILVAGTGEVVVDLGSTVGEAPDRQARFLLSEASSEKWEALLLRFVEANTPKLP